MIPKKSLIIIVAVVLVVAMLFFSGVISFSIVVNDVTENYTHGGISGSGELIGPNARKGFIMSWKNDGHSEFITVTGRTCIDTWASGGINAYRYQVYGKTATSTDWEPLSEPGDTKRYISNPNPGVIPFSGLQVGGCDNADSYSFTMIGSDYRAIRVICQGRIDWNLLNPFDDGWQWRTLQSDEAVMYEGHGGLYLPRGIDDDRPYSTFEIGQEVKIRVETTKGGATVGDSASWKVTLNEPYGGNIADPTDGGAVVKTETYGDDHVGYFTFVVTEEMARKSMNSPHPYSVRIWNTILPKGTLDIDFIDFVGNAPGDVLFAGPDQSKVGETATVKLTTEINEDTGLEIDYFRVSVIYGPSNILLPSEWSSHLWLVHTTNVPAIGSGDTTYTASISFTPNKESYVTVHSKAVDVGGRASLRTQTWTMWIYDGSPVPDDVVDDETGQNDYGGGHSSDWLPWDPGGGNWEDFIDISWLGVLIAFLIVIAFAIAGFVIYKKPQMMLIFALVGLVVAVLVYVYFFTSIFTGG